MQVNSDLANYDTYIVAFSGGKDSIATFLWLIDQGVDRSKIELWHHDIDGRESGTLMDWPVTRDYCAQFAKAFDVKIYFSWKVGGFEREMLRDGTETAPTKFETPEGLLTTGGNSGKLNTRLQFPMVSPDLSKRWCSAYLKIDVCAAAIRNQKRFNGKKTLVLTGERALESAARAKYASFEVDRSDARDGRLARHVDHMRPVHGWTEHQVWAIIQAHRVNPHPAYKLGWGRVSCLTCIFGSKNQWASAAVVAPEQVLRIAEYETQFGKTISADKVGVLDKMSAGKPYEGCRNAALVATARSHSFEEPIITETWTLPAGAYSGETCGPE